MLSHLIIRNYALIDSLEVDFGKGLIVLTGETGAGKSIIMEALETLLGERADSGVLKNKNEKCIIEGEFSIGDYQLQDFFSEHEIDYAAQTILRREINSAGKSRAFINDTPVNLTLLRQLSAQLVDIHSQHQTLDLGKQLNQLEILDAVGDCTKETKQYHQEFQQYHNTQIKLQQLKEQESKAKLDLDYFQFQLSELLEAKIQSGEFEDQEKELELLNHAEEIKSALDQASQVVQEEQRGIVQLLKQLKLLLSKTADFHPVLGELNQRVESSLIELKDIAGEIDRVNDELIFDPAKLQMLGERVNFIQSLFYKHRVKSSEELLSVQQDLEEKVNSISSLDEQIAKLEKELQKQLNGLLKSAKEIHASRSKAIPGFEKEIRELLDLVAMPHAELKVELSATETPGPYGTDQLRFMFKTNKGGEFKELNKIASGGEFARLMLAIKSVLAKVKTLPVIIFDEIDTGVSGEVAHKMGSIMREMAKNMQVFCITHLPQVAVKGNEHFKVYKETSKNTTETKIMQLSKEQRIEEIAKMLSGDKLSDAALANARELMEVK